MEQDKQTLDRIACVGDNCIDVYVNRGLEFVGGNAVNVAVNLRKMGWSTSYYGPLGQDEAGRRILNALSARGVDTSRCRMLAGRTAVSRCRLEDDGDIQFVGYHEGVIGSPWIDEDASLWLEQFRLVHSSVYSGTLGLLEGLADPVASFDFSTRLDLSIHEAFLGGLDLVFLSGSRWDERGICRMLYDLSGATDGVCVVTAGKRGAYAQREGSILHQKATPASRVTDTMGAGDAFIAGCIDAFLKGRGLSEMLQAGARMGAETCAFMGGFKQEGAAYGEDV